MSRLLLLGYPPPPWLDGQPIEAAHYRTWQFLTPLAEDGHAVCCCIGTHAEPAGPLRVPPDWPDRLTCHAIAFGRSGWIAALQAAHDAFRPDAVVAVNFSHCLYATKLHTAQPIWMDIYGDLATIVQAATYRAGSDRGVHTSLAFLRHVLARGDVFSACSTAQAHAMVGELAMAARLNKRTFAYPFVHVVPAGVPPPPAARTSPPPGTPRSRPLLAARGVAADAFVVLWCGGYNTWTDVETLFRGVELALSRYPSLVYVSCGGSAYRAADDVYARFCALAAASSHRGRFHLLGWRPWTEVQQLYRESDAGLCVDGRHYETTYGTRTRLVEMLGAALPVVTSHGTELSGWLATRGAAITFTPGDADGLARGIGVLSGDRDAYRVAAAAAHAAAAGELSFAGTTAPLREWVRAPAPAPDHRPLSRSERLRNAEYRARALVRSLVWRFAGRDR